MFVKNRMKYKWEKWNNEDKIKNIAVASIPGKNRNRIVKDMELRMLERKKMRLTNTASFHFLFGGLEGKITQKLEAKKKKIIRLLA